MPQAIPHSYYHCSEDRNRDSSCGLTERVFLCVWGVLTWPLKAGPHSRLFGRPLWWPLQARVWAHVQDWPRQTCPVRMIWVKAQHAQPWPWSLNQGGKGKDGPPFLVRISVHGQRPACWFSIQIIPTRRADIGWFWT